MPMRDPDGGSDDASASGSDTANVVMEDEEEGNSSTEEESEEEVEDDEHRAIHWTGLGKRIPVLVFKADAIVTKRPEIKAIGEKYHLAFKMGKTESKIIRSILSSHGFNEAHPNSNDYNLMWTGSHLKPYVLRSLLEFQKVNHFPRSYEITRKDRLFKNIQRMQQTKGYKNFDFVPQSYIVPGEFQEFCSAFLKDKGPWIVKPIASSRGRGIFLINHPEQVPLDETQIVCRYLNNPLLIDGFKFDVRLYVAVSSYDPLVVYLYEEGLTRFATVRYEKGAKSIRNQMMHLTNYSVNKKSNEYVKNDDPDIEDYGNKWSLGALLRYLRTQGKDTTALMMRVEDVIIKTLLSAELPIATACKMFMPFRGNCFELYGFDILIDENLRPWVLEVNLSPSLACDSPLDLKIKSSLLSDLFSLVGFICQDPMIRKNTQKKPPDFTCRGSAASRAQSALYRPSSSLPHRVFQAYGSVASKATLLERLSLEKKEPRSWKPKQKNRPSSASSGKGPKANVSGLSSEEIKMTRRAKEEYHRRGNWIRIFPSPDSWELYGSYLQYSTGNNLTLYQQLFPDRAKNLPAKPTTASYSSGLARAKSFHLHSAAYPQLHISSQADEALANALQRSLQYERKLSALGEKRRRKTNQRKITNGAPSIHAIQKSTLAQGIAQEISSDAPPSTVASRTTPGTTAERSLSQNRSRQAKSTSVSQSQGKVLEAKPPKPRRETDGNKPSRGEPIPSRRSPSPDTPSPPPPQPRETSPPPPAPRTPSPPPLPEPKYNVVELLERGKTMSKVQARFAFATYLTRVQHRLMAETSTTEPDDIEAANEQMDLVLRFLKRAAGNLQQPFKVVVPSRKLPLNDRRRILAKQLGDFVHIYNKETDQLRQRNDVEKKHLKRPPSFTANEGLDEEPFDNFVNKANESELEEVLTTYTKLNKSASIFLGSNSKTTLDHRTGTYPNGSGGQSHSDTCLAKRKDNGEMYAPSKTSPHEEISVSKANVSAGNRSEAHSSSSGSSNTTLNSYASAVSIYSAKLGGPNLSSFRNRPASATSVNTRRTQSTVSSLKSRPMSASNPRPVSASRGPPTSQRERPDGAEYPDQQYDEAAINDALHRLTIRQQQRQYTATKGSNILAHQPDPDFPELLEEQGSALSLRHRTHSLGSVNIHELDAARPNIPNTKIQTNVENFDVVHSTDSPSCAHDSVGESRRIHPRSSSANRSMRTANDTFDSFVQDTYGYGRELVTAYSQVTGVNPVNETYTPSLGSSQYQYAQQQQQIKQQRMIEQSKALLEQSRMKHQQMIAQAHAATKHRKEPQEPVSGVQMYAPKPPPAPPSDRKSTSTHRLARTAMFDNEPSSFYNSLKYDSASGTAKVVHSSGYNT